MHGARALSHVVTVVRSGPGNATHQHQHMVADSVMVLTKNIRTVKRIFVQDTSVTGLPGRCVVPAVAMEVYVNAIEPVKEGQVAMGLQEK